MTFLVRTAFLLYAIAVLVAIWIQDHSGALPLGLFNEGRREYQWLSAASLVLFAAIAAPTACGICVPTGLDMETQLVSRSEKWIGICLPWIVSSRFPKAWFTKSRSG